MLAFAMALPNHRRDHPLSTKTTLATLASQPSVRAILDSRYQHTEAAAAISNQTGETITESSVRRWRKKNRPVTSTADSARQASQEAAEEPLEAPQHFIDQEPEGEDLAAQNARLLADNRRLFARATKLRARGDEYIDAVYRAARDAAQFAPRIVTPTRRPGPNLDGSPEGALMHTTDWQGGKALADDTPVLTTDGWTTHGALRPGMYVYNPEGKPVQITAVTGSSLQECAVVQFDKGVEIIASMDHLWSGYRRYKTSGDDQYSRRDLTWTTAQIAALPKVRVGKPRESVDRAFHVDVVQPLALPMADLPVDPYHLGVWLGDGTASDNRIAVGDTDVDYARTLGGVVVKYQSAQCHTMTLPQLSCAALRSIGVLNNKHIPENYLLADAEQRLSLLQGLLDTDGTISDKGMVEFSNTNKNLSDGVAYLARSLGMKVHRAEKWGMLYGVQKKRVYRVTFLPHLPVFRMPRKAERVRTDWSDNLRYRYVQDVRPVGLVSAQCITVDGSLYVAGEDFVTTHNCTESYDFAVMEERVKRYVDKVYDIVELHRKSTNVDEGLLLVTGDMVEGVTIFPGQVWELDGSLYEQIFRVANLLEWMIREVRTMFTDLDVVLEYGNHGRIGSKRDGIKASDNIDRIVYGIVGERVSDIVRKYQFSGDWYQHFTFGNYRAMAIHGDEIKSFGGNLPSYGIIRKANSWASGVVPTFTDLYLGHYHQSMQLQLANGGSVFMTGSPESDNVFAAEFVAATGRPSQRLNFVNLDKGEVTAEYRIWLS